MSNFFFNNNKFTAEKFIQLYLEYQIDVPGNIEGFPTIREKLVELFTSNIPEERLIIKLQQMELFLEKDGDSENSTAFYVLVVRDFMLFKNYSYLQSLFLLYKMFRFCGYLIMGQRGYIEKKERMVGITQKIEEFIDYQMNEKTLELTKVTQKVLSYDFDNMTEFVDIEDDEDEEEFSENELQEKLYQDVIKKIYFKENTLKNENFLIKDEIIIKPVQLFKHYYRKEDKEIEDVELEKKQNKNIEETLINCKNKIYKPILEKFIEILNKNIIKNCVFFALTKDKMVIDEKYTLRELPIVNLVKKLEDNKKIREKKYDKEIIKESLLYESFVIKFYDFIRKIKKKIFIKLKRNINDEIDEFLFNNNIKNFRKFDYSKINLKKFNNIKEINENLEKIKYDFLKMDKETYSYYLKEILNKRKKENLGNHIMIKFLKKFGFILLEFQIIILFYRYDLEFLLKKRIGGGVLYYLEKKHHLLRKINKNQKIQIEYKKMKNEKEDIDFKEIKKFSDEMKKYRKKNKIKLGVTERKKLFKFGSFEYIFNY